MLGTASQLRHPKGFLLHGFLYLSLVPVLGCTPMESASSAVNNSADAETGSNNNTDNKNQAVIPTSSDNPDRTGPETRVPGPSNPNEAAQAAEKSPAREPPQKRKTSSDDNQSENARGARHANATENGKEVADTKNELISKNPFPMRYDIPDFPKDVPWLNTAGPLRKQDLRGKFVLLDFWTYCCINCIHILPELKKLEREFPNELIVIGVHSAKFDNEKDNKNIEEAILRYEIEHPVVNDSDHNVWETYGINSWPTVLLIDPEGYLVWGRKAEIQFEDVAPLLRTGIEYYREKGSLDSTPIRFELLAHRDQKTPLRFPGKVLADEKSNRLFIADSNHNRIVITDLDGKLLDIIGVGSIGKNDGAFEKATFDHPQGMTLAGDTLYVADTENHLLRKIDIKQRRVTTIAGTGVQSRNAWPGIEGLTRFDQLPDRFVGKPATTALNSPWDLWVHEHDLYIAMAGPHQIWKMPLDESEIGPYAGNGLEDIVDGPLLPRAPQERGYASFAQPSGLSSDGVWLFVADSEGSSIRAVPFDRDEEVRTVIGTSHLPHSRLFTFGDVDGEPKDALLQHALGVAYHDNKIYVTDTYNNKIKEVDAKTGVVKTLAGMGKPGLADEPAQFDEPAGISQANGLLFIADTNNHAIRTVDLKTGKVATLAIDGLTYPTPKAQPKKPDFASAAKVRVAQTVVKATEGTIKLSVQLQLPEGWKINEDAPSGYWLEAESETGPIDRGSLGEKKLEGAQPAFDISIPVRGTGDDTITVSMRYFYCQKGGEGLCKIGSVVWNVPLRMSNDGASNLIKLEHQVDAR